MENHSPCLKNSPQSLQPSPSILSNLPLENSAALGSPLIKRSKPQDSLSLLPQALHPTQEPLDPTADLAESLFVAVAVSTPSDLPPTAQEDGTIRCICLSIHNHKIGCWPVLFKYLNILFLFMSFSKI